MLLKSPCHATLNSTGNHHTAIWCFRWKNFLYTGSVWHQLCWSFLVSRHLHRRSKHLGWWSGIAVTCLSGFNEGNEKWSWAISGHSNQCSVVPASYDNSELLTKLNLWLSWASIQTNGTTHYDIHFNIVGTGSACFEMHIIWHLLVAEPTSISCLNHLSRSPKMLKISLDYCMVKQ